ncbi:MAG: hypothetical protein E6J78_13205 [Deltaproteobacteria bacterium]|nr:MAG: hypothetical protein E6J78_13205 [Deltaproteobacteria bacterium]
MLRGLVVAIRRFFSRRRGRKLLKARLPRGLPADAPALRLALRVPFDPPPGEFWTAPLPGAAAARLLRLSALPPPHRPLQIVRPDNFRVDPATLQIANEGILPLEPRDTSYRWIHPDFRRRHLDTPWMAQDRIDFLAPQKVEWFALWWFEGFDHRPGARGPRSYQIKKEIEWEMQRVKEQMLIRRDTSKDERPPAAGTFSRSQIGQPIASFEAQPDLSSHLPEKPWIDPAQLAREPPPEIPTREAFLQRRTLLDALEER